MYKILCYDDRFFLVDFSVIINRKTIKTDNGFIEQAKIEDVIVNKVEEIKDFTANIRPMHTIIDVEKLFAT